MLRHGRAALLFGALCVGNPFLACHEPTVADAPTRDGGVATSSGPAQFPADQTQAAQSPAARSVMAPLLAPPTASPVQPVVQPAALMAHSGAASRSIELASSPVRRPLLEVANHARDAGLATDAALHKASLVRWPCPDPALQDAVVRVELGDGARGEVVWVLRDGRRLRRNPILRAGAPLLIDAGVEDE